MRSLVVVSITLVVVAALVTPTAHARWKDPSKDDWIIASTEDLVVVSGASELRTRRMIEEVSRFRIALEQLTTTLQADVRQPIRLYLFRNDRQYEPYKKRADGSVMQVSGYFQATPFAHYITLDTSSGQESVRYIYHEYVHAVLQESVGDVPLWLNEGLAEYLSTFRTGADGELLEVGHPVYEHLDYLAMVRRIPWSDVFATTHDSETYNEGRRQGAFYAQSWLLVHWLSSSEERARRLGRYVSALRNGEDPDAAREALLGMDLDALTETMDHYRTSRQFAYRTLQGTADTSESAEVEMRPLERAELLYRLGDLLARTGQADDAQTYMRKALAAGSPEGPVLTSLGYLAYAAGDTASAEERLRRAIELETDLAEPYLLLGTILIERRFTAALDGSDPSSVAADSSEIEALFRAGLERESNNVLGLLGLSMACVLADEAEQGLEAVSLARSLRPLDPHVLEVQACLLAISGRPLEAWTLAVRGLEAVDSDGFERAGDCIESGIKLFARKRLETGDREGALGALDAATAAIGDPRRVERLQTVRSYVSEGGDIRVFSPDVRREDVARLQDVFGLLHAGRYDEALAGLEALTAEGVDDVVRGEAARLLDEVRSMRDEGPLIERYNEALELANAAEFDAALAILDDVAASAGEGRLRTSAVELAESIRRAQEGVARYNEAIELANAGQLEQAVAIMEDLASTATDPIMRADAERVAGQMRERLRRRSQHDRFRRALELNGQDRLSEAEELLIELESEELEAELAQRVATVLQAIRAVRSR